VKRVRICHRCRGITLDQDRAGSLHFQPAQQPGVALELCPECRWLLDIFIASGQPTHLAQVPGLLEPLAIPDLQTV
jgi:hypothetical protein